MQGILSLIIVGLTLAWTHPATAQAKPAPGLVWTDIRTLAVEGRGWTNTGKFFDRLPAKAEQAVRPPVWQLAHNSAGLLVRFITDATNIHARWALTSPSLAMPHMAATGVSGLDLYVRTSARNWHWLGIGIPKEQTNSAALANNLAPGKREYMLYLPLYNGVSFVELGIPADAVLEPAGPWGVGERKPIVFYGTSVLQGGCATRPGMAHVAIVGRHLNWPTINLGFSGNGKMEPEMGELFAELDPAAYVLDCVPNMTVQEVAERVEPFVRRLRAAHPRTPIILVEDRSWQNTFLIPGRQAHHRDTRANLQTAYKNLQRAGVKNLHYVRGENLLGTDGEGTVDGSHPTDLGFMRQAEAMVKALKPLLHP